MLFEEIPHFLDSERLVSGQSNRTSGYYRSRNMSCVLLVLSFMFPGTVIWMCGHGERDFLPQAVS